MVAFTASQLLPYAEDTDQVCDSPEIIQLLAETVEARLAAIEDSYDSLALRPAGKMKSVPQPAYVLFDTINFDSVEFDIGNIIDLDIDQQAFRIPPLESGAPDETWLHGSFVGATGSGVSTDLFTIGLSNPSGAFYGDQREDLTFNLGHTAHIFYLGSGTLEPRAYTWVDMSTAGSPPVTVNLFNAEHYAYKIGDLT